LDDATESASKKPDIGLLRAWQAEFFADQGDATGAETALNTLRNGFSVLPDTVTTGEVSARGWPEGHLRFTEAFVYSISATRQRLTPPSIQHSASFPSNEREDGPTSSSCAPWPSSTKA